MTSLGEKNLKNVLLSQVEHEKYEGHLYNLWI